MRFFTKLLLVLFVFNTILLNAQDNPKENPNRVIVNVDLGKETISKYIYGHFAEHLGHCIYGGIYVGENSTIPNTRGIRNDVVEALKEIGPAVVRWPGGCFADTYHWKDGIGPQDQRPQLLIPTGEG